MNWNRLYGLRGYLKSSLWLVPFIAIPFNLVATRILHWLDAWLGWTLMGYGVPGAQAVLQAIVTATLSFVVFTFASLLVAIQVASAQLTPRIIATTLLRNDVIKYTVGLFTFTLLFALSVQNRIEKDVHQLVMVIAALLGLFSFAAFFYLIDYAARLLRPISILAHVSNSGLAVIESVYPDPSLDSDTLAGEGLKFGSPDRIIQHQGTSGIVLAVNSTCSWLRQRDRTVSSNSDLRWAILLPWTNLCSTCMAVPARSTRRLCVHPSRSGPSARSFAVTPSMPGAPSLRVSR